MSDDSVWAVEWLDESGDPHHTVCQSADALGNFVRVNADDAAQYRISATTLENLADLRINETFDEDDA